MSASEPTPDRALIEDLETKISVIGEAYAAVVMRVDAVKAELETRIRQNDNRIMDTDVKLRLKIRELDEEIRQELGKLDRKTDDLGHKLGELELKLVALERSLSAKSSAS